MRLVVPFSAGSGADTIGRITMKAWGGASPREVLEVIFQTCANFGMPPMMQALERFIDHGRRRPDGRNRQPGAADRIVCEVIVKPMACSALAATTNRIAGPVVLSYVLDSFPAG